MGETSSSHTTFTQEDSHTTFTQEDRATIGEIMQLVRQQHFDMKDLMAQIDIEKPSADMSDASTQTDPTEADLFGHSEDEEKEAEEPKAEEPMETEPKAEEPDAEEPKAEEPDAEEPDAEEPKAEEPKAEEPKADSDTSSVKSDSPEPAKKKGKDLDEMLKKEREKRDLAIKNRDKAIKKLEEANEAVDANDFEKFSAEVEDLLAKSDEKFNGQLKKATEKNASEDKIAEIQKKLESARNKFNKQLQTAEAKVASNISKRDTAVNDLAKKETTVAKKEASVAKMEREMCATAK